MIQNIRFGLHKLYHPPNGPDGKHVCLPKRVHFQSSHKRDLLELGALVASLAITTPCHDRESGAIAQTVALSLGVRIAGLEDRLGDALELVLVDFGHVLHGDLV